MRVRIEGEGVRGEREKRGRGEREQSECISTSGLTSSTSSLEPSSSSSSSSSLWKGMSLILICRSAMTGSPNSFPKQTEQLHVDHYRQAATDQLEKSTAEVKSTYSWINVKPL